MKKFPLFLTCAVLFFLASSEPIRANPTMGPVIYRSDLFTIFNEVPLIITLSIFAAVVLIEAAILKLLTSLDFSEGLLYSLILNVFSGMAGAIFSFFWGGLLIIFFILLLVAMPVYFRKVILKSIQEKRFWVYLVSYVMFIFGSMAGFTGIGQLVAGFGLAVFTETAFALQYLEVENPARFANGMIIGNVATHLLIAIFILIFNPG